jgi:hypothetical protein
VRNLALLPRHKGSRERVKPEGEKETTSVSLALGFAITRILASVIAPGSGTMA